MGGDAEEGGAGLAPGEDARFTLDAEVEPGVRGDEADQRLGPVDVEIVHDEMPAGRRGVGGQGALDVGEEVGLGPGLAGRGSDDLAGGHIAIDDERERTMADALELALLDAAGLRGQAWVLAVERLDAGQFACAQHPSPRSANSGAAW